VKPKYCVKFEQNDMDGRSHKYEECFYTPEARENFIEQRKASANFLNLPLRIISRWRKE